MAGVNEIEVELQPFGWQRTGSQSAAVAPFVVYNYGFADRWEVVFQTEMLTPITGGGEPSVAANAAFLKYVIQPGVLQGQSGISIATEFGPLLPGINADPGVGFSWVGIVSQRWDWGTAHFNVETNLTRDQHGEAFLDVILEGPSTWKVRPVLEMFYDKVWTQTETRSVLLGAIWQVETRSQPRCRVSLCAGQRTPRERDPGRIDLRVQGRRRQDADQAGRLVRQLGTFALKGDIQCAHFGA